MDGEGSICIRRKRYNERTNNYYMSVMVTQKDGRLIDWLIGNIGGSTYLHWKGTPTGWSHEWIVNHNKAKEFLKSILPFLTIKKRQAELAIRFQERVNVFKRRHERDSEGKFLPKRIVVGEHELEKRKELFEELKAQKKKYQFSKAPNIQRRIQEKVNSAALTTEREYTL